jgi:hypothetical protein
MNFLIICLKYNTSRGGGRKAIFEADILEQEEE